MSTIAFSSDQVLKPAEVEWGIRASCGVWTSPYTGDVVTREYPWPRVVCTLTYDPAPAAIMGARMALFAQLRGRANRLALWNLSRPRPLGTQVAAAAVKTSALQGATSITLKSATAGATLQVGDWFGVGGMLFMCVSNAVVAGTGEVTLAFEPPARKAIAADAVVTFNKPTALFILDSDEIRWGLRNVTASGFSVGLTEVFA